MKRWLLHIWMIGVLGMLTASCSQEAVGLDLDTDGKVQVMFTIALDSPSAGSRATWGDNYDSAIGDDFDNYINPDQFFVKLTLGNTTYDVQNIAHWQQAGNKNVYEFVGEVDVNINTTTTYTNAKIMVYANMNPASTFGTEVFEPNYNINQSIARNPNGVAYIPMWGVQTVNLSLTPGTRTELIDPIYLLRSMAKVEVALTAPEYTLTKVVLKKYNKIGNCLPVGAADVNNTKDLNFDNVNAIDSEPYCFNPNATSAGTDLAFTVTSNHLIFYMPEISNANDDLAMEVTLERDGDEVTLSAPYLYFRNYSTNTAFDVVRNHWYQYNITAIGKSLDYTADIKPWSSATKEVNIIVEDFHWLYVKDKVLYMNNINTIKTAFDSSTDDLTYNITDVRVYNTTTAWNTSVNGGQSVSIAKTQKGDITITSDIPDNFVGKEFKVTVSSATSGKSETIQVYQFPPLYLTLKENSQNVDAGNSQTNSSVYEITTLLADFSWLPSSGTDLELNESGFSHSGSLNNRRNAGTAVINYLKQCKFGYPQTETIHYNSVTSTIYNTSTTVSNINANTTIETSENGNIISPHFILASQGGANSISNYDSAKQNCAGYRETVKNADGTTTTYASGTWRVPTKAELMLIDLLQNITKSQVKKILEGETYIYTKNPTDNDYDMMDPRVLNTHAVRCVRDIK